MSSTDDTRNSDADGGTRAGESPDESFAPPRRRRSTYTPPPQYRDDATEPEPAAAAAGKPGEPAPVPSDPVPSDPVPSDPVPSAPEPASPDPADPVPSAPVPSGPDPSGPGPLAPDPIAPLPEVPVPAPGTPETPPPAIPELPPIPEVPRPGRPDPETPSPEAPVPDGSAGADAEPATATATAKAPADAPPPAWPTLKRHEDLPPEPLHEPPEPYQPWVPQTSAASTAPVPDAHAWQSLPAADRPPTLLTGELNQGRPVAAEPGSLPHIDEHATALATHAPPAGRPWVPQRRSLLDDELLGVLTAAEGQPGGTLSAMDALEYEMRLREDEVQEFREWESTMRAVGTPEALAVVEEVRPQFTGIVVPPELTTSQIPVQDASAVFGHGTATVSPSVAAPQPAPAPGLIDALIAPPGAADAPTTDAPTAAGPEQEQGRMPLFTLEISGEEPTPAEYRVGRASRLFWLWFAANSSILSIGFGAMVFSLGLSLRQAMVAALAGVALSFIPLGLGTLAGKRSGQPTVVVSRAAFGVAGNVLPAALAVVSRVFWGAVLLWLFATSVAAIVTGADGSAVGSLVIVFVLVGIGAAALVAFYGYALLARVQLIVSLLSALLILGFMALTFGQVDLRVALTAADGPWILVVSGAVLVFSFVGLVWANSSSDLARYQRPSALGGQSMLWATFGATLPAFLLIAYGSLLAASDPALAAGLSQRPIETLAGILPGWYTAPLLAVTALSLLSGVIITVYSGAFALQGVGLRLERHWASLVMAGLVAAIAVLFAASTLDLTAVIRDLATTLAVPVAAWAGIFAADIMIRNRSFHTGSLLRPGGVYPNANWVNLGALVAATLVGWGLTTATLTGLSWQGYIFAAAGLDRTSDAAASDLGVVVALVLGLLTPIVSGVSTIRRQEQPDAR